jgi:hypothetical protein
MESTINWDCDEWNCFTKEKLPSPEKLKFIEESFSDFEKNNNIDPFFYNLAGDLLTQYKVQYEYGPWIAGGFLTRAVQGETLENFSGDLDVWFNNNDQQNHFAQDLNDGKFGLEAIPAERFKSNYSYSYIVKYKDRDIKVQLISYKKFPTIEDLMGRFDMFSAMIGTDGVKVFYEADKALTCAKNKKMLFNWDHLNSKTAHPDARYVLKRYTKFIKAGYSVDNSEINRFTELLKKLPIPDQESFCDGYGHF